MATTWTTTKSKQRLSWQGPEPQAVSGTEYQLQIGGGYLLDLGANGNNLTIQSATTGTSWEQVSKKKLSWSAQPQDQVELLIGDTYKLTIGDDFQLNISGGGRNKTLWTKTTKTGR